MTPTTPTLPPATQGCEEFRAFCAEATTAQLMNIYEKELFAERMEYAGVAMQELLRPGRALK